jgi:hypothetical protein
MNIDWPEAIVFCVNILVVGAVMCFAIWRRTKADAPKVVQPKRHEWKTKEEWRGDEARSLLKAKQEQP